MGRTKKPVRKVEGTTEPLGKKAPNRTKSRGRKKTTPALNTKSRYSSLSPSTGPETRSRIRKKMDPLPISGGSKTRSKSISVRPDKRRKTKAASPKSAEYEEIRRGRKSKKTEKPSKLTRKMKRKDAINPKVTASRMNAGIEKPRRTRSSSSVKTRSAKPRKNETASPKELRTSSATVPNIKGAEAGVPWFWTANPKIQIQGEKGKPKNVAVHPLHNNRGFGVGGNLFYGGLTALTDKGNVVHSETKEFTPKKGQHTEKQYFNSINRIQKKLEKKILASEKIDHLVMEMNQKNTPCSKATCRPKILSTVKGSKSTTPQIHARLSAENVYETQPPKFNITNMQGKKMKKAGTKPVVLKDPSVVHMVPRNMS